MQRSIQMDRQFQYRIYTEQKNIIEIEAILDRYFQSYNMYFPTSRFNGRAELGCVIELIGAQALQVDSAAVMIGRLNSQEQVLVTKVPIDCCIIETKIKNATIYDISMRQSKKDGETK